MIVCPERDLYQPVRPSLPFPKASSGCGGEGECSLVFSSALLEKPFVPPGGAGSIFTYLMPSLPFPSRARYPAALEMTRHFFEMELEQTEKERLREVCEKKRELTPATVEQLAGEHDALDDFLTALEALP